MSAGLEAALEATWPAARRFRAGPWTIRDGAGGGKRVSAATAEADWRSGDLGEAEAAMRALGQVPLFRVRAGEEALDAALAERSYRLADPTLFYEIGVGQLAPFPPPMAGFAHWPPLAIVRGMWRQDGIGAARQAVMERVAGPHAAVVGRTGDRPSGAAFVAVSERIAMLHALVVPAAMRRQGAGRSLVGRVAAWAGEQGAERLALAVTAGNGPARALYASIGMEAVGQYHYRTL